NAIKQRDELVVEKVLSETTYDKFNSFKRKFKKMAFDEMEQYIEKNVHHCSLTEFPLAFYNLEEAVFSPLALSVNNAIYLSWNANSNAYIPVSSMASLFMFFAAARGPGSHGNPTSIFFGGPFDESYQVNTSAADLKSSQKTFAEISFDLVR